jgi:hypothetical protein
VLANELDKSRLESNLFNIRLDGKNGYVEHNVDTFMDQVNSQINKTDQTTSALLPLPRQMWHMWLVPSALWLASPLASNRRTCFRWVTGILLELDPNAKVGKGLLQAVNGPMKSASPADTRGTLATLFRAPPFHTMCGVVDEEAIPLFPASVCAPPLTL